MKTERQHATAGFSTIEILIAFAVGIVFISAGMMVAFSDPSLTKQVSLDSGQAAALDATLDNYGLIKSGNKMGEILSGLAANWNSDPSSDTETINSVLAYTNTPDMLDISPCLKQVTNATTWDTLNDRARNVTFGTAISDMDVAEDLGLGGCDPTPPGDWDNPEDPDWDVTPSELDGHGTGVAVVSIDGTDYAFITTEQSGNPDSSDFWVIDASNPADPNPVANISTGVGLNGLVIANGYAFVIQNDSLNQLQVVDVSNPTGITSASVVAQATLPGVGNSHPEGWSIAYFDDHLYIGTKETAGPEFHIYDVTNPTTPVWKSSREINHNVNKIALKRQVVGGTLKTVAYLATSAENPAAPELTILDVTNPSVTPTPLGSFNPSGTHYGTSVYVLGDTLYLGRERATGANSDFYMLNITNPASLSVIKQKKLNLNPNTAVIDIVVHGRLAFLVVSDSNSTFQVWDVLSNPTSIVSVNSSCSNILNLAKSRALAYKNNNIFVVNDNNAALNILRDNPNVCTP